MVQNSESLNQKKTAIEIEMKKRLESILDLKHFEVKDFTGRHINHDLHNGGFHLEVIIVSKSFEEKSLVQRHKLVYEAMGELMKHEIHALSMKTLTLIEWEEK